MAANRAILAPKFAAVDTALSTELAGLGIADWSKPDRRLFRQSRRPDGTATRVVALAKSRADAAGRRAPMGKDEHD